MSTFVDFHTHLHAYDDHEALLADLEADQIVSVACSVDIESFIATQKLALKSKLVISTFGIHPNYADTVQDMGDLDQHLKSSSIIGEIGLDKAWSTVAFDQQVRVFEYILDHCHRNQKYCVIHTKGAELEVSQILKNFPRAKPIIHWYHGPEDIIKEFWNRAYPCTISVEIHYSEFVKKLAREMPAELLLSETDNPTSEEWLGGTSRHPNLIKRVVADIAIARNGSLGETRDLIYQNSRRILLESKVGFFDPS